MLSLLKEQLSRPWRYQGGGKGGSQPAAPDYTALAASNEKAATLAAQSAQNSLDFSKQQYADVKPALQNILAQSQAAGQQQQDIANQNQTKANAQWQDYQNTYAPMEQQTALTALGGQYLSAEDRSKLTSAMNDNTMSATDRTNLYGDMSQKAQGAAAQQAQTGAEAQTQSAYADQARNLTRMGGDPSRIAAAAAGLAQNQALSQTQAANQARQAAYGQQTGLQTGVANFGRNMPNTAGQAFGLATQAGAQGVNTMSAGANAGMGYNQQIMNGYGNQMNAQGMGINANLGMGGLMNQGYSTGMQGYIADQNSANAGLAGLGQLAGTGMAAYKLGMFSDRRLKMNITFLETRPDGLAVYAFKYLPELDPTNSWVIGCMADEVEEVYPEAVTVGEDGYQRVNYAAIG